MNLKQLRDEREAAGKAYAKVMEKLREAWIRLAAIDETLSNRIVNPLDPQVNPQGVIHSRFISGDRMLVHGEFYPHRADIEWWKAAKAIADKQIEAFQS